MSMHGAHTSVIRTRRQVGARGSLLDPARPPSGPVAGHAPHAERETLLQEVEVVGVRLVAELRRLEPVLDAEHRLAGVDERIESPALAVLMALLVQRGVEVRQQRAYLAEIVLQQRRQAATVRL